MKVLVLCAAGIVSGKETMCLHLMQQLKQRGHQSYCIMSSWGSNEFVQRLTGMGVPHFKLRLGFISKTLQWPAIRMTLVQAFYLPFLWLKYKRLMTRLQPDVVIHTNFHHVFLLYPVLGTQRSLYWSHEVTPPSRFYTWLFGLFQKKIQQFVAVSHVTGRSLEVHLQNLQVTVINNGLPLPPVQGQAEKPNVVPHLAIIGQVSRHKGHEVLLKALAQLTDKNFVLHIFGAGLPDYVQYLQHLTAEYQLEQRVKWHGFVSDPENIYRGMDLVIVPSIFCDPFPTTVIEAGIRGIAVVGSANGGIPEMIEDDVNGWKFQTGDDAALAQLLMHILESGKYLQLKEKCRKYAQDRFSLDRFLNAFERVLKSLAA